MSKKISELTAATDVTASDLFQVVDIEDPAMASSGTNKKVTAQTLGNYLPVRALGSTTSRTLSERFGDTVNVKDFGAAGDGIQDDTVAIQAAVNTSRQIMFPFGTYKTDGVITGNFQFVSIGADFTGTNSLDSKYAPFGKGSLKTYARGNLGSMIGIAHNDLPAATWGFPTGVTGYGRNDNAGNAAFGIYAEARQYSTSGGVTNEIDSFNHGGAPSAALPPDRSIGSIQNHPIALTVGAGGDYDSSIGIHIVGEGSSPQGFLTGLYLQPACCKTYGIFLDSTAVDTHTPLVIAHATNRVGLNIITRGSVNVDNAFLSYSDGNGVNKFSIKQDGKLLFRTAITQLTHGVAGAADALPATPAGYLKIQIDGDVKVIPYYNE